MGICAKRAAASIQQTPHEAKRHQVIEQYLQEKLSKKADAATNLARLQDKAAGLCALLPPYERRLVQRKLGAYRLHPELLLARRVVGRAGAQAISQLNSTSDAHEAQNCAERYFASKAKPELSVVQNKERVNEKCQVLLPLVMPSVRPWVRAAKHVCLRELGT